jgi:hypothetical protein
MKLMKIAGVIGIIFLVLSLISFVYFLISNPLKQNNLVQSVGKENTSSAYSILIIIIASVLYLASLVFLIGFVKMGSKTSKLLKISAIIMIILSIVIVIFTITSVIMLKNALNTWSSGLVGSSVAPDMSSLKNTAYTLFIIFAILFVLSIIATVLFYIGMIIAGKQVKFARLGGISGLAAVVLGIITTSIMAIFIYKMIKDPQYLTNFFMSTLLTGKVSNPYLNSAYYLSIITWVVGLVALLFMSLSLFDASKKFESSISSTSSGQYPSQTQFQQPQQVQQIQQIQQETQPILPNLSS